MGIARRSRDDETFTFVSPPPGLHLFYTLSKNGLPNSTLNNVVCGDVFILKISDYLKDGLNYYADIGRGDLDFLEDLLGELIVQRCRDIDNPDWCWGQRDKWTWAIRGDLYDNT